MLLYCLGYLNILRAEEGEFTNLKLSLNFSNMGHFKTAHRFFSGLCDTVIEAHEIGLQVRRGGEFFFDPQKRSYNQEFPERLQGLRNGYDEYVRGMDKSDAVIIGTHFLAYCSYPLFHPVKAYKAFKIARESRR